MTRSTRSTPLVRASRAMVAVVVVAASGAAACSEHHDHGPPGPIVTTEPTFPGESTLVVRWTIDGLVDPNECVKSASAVIEISIRDPNGIELSAWQQACTAFAISIPLAPGLYNATAVLLDGIGNPRTTAVFIAPFTLVGNDTLDLSVDFPASSFL